MTRVFLMLLLFWPLGIASWWLPGSAAFVLGALWTALVYRMVEAELKRTEPENRLRG